MLNINEPVDSVTVVPPGKHNVKRVNSIKKLYPNQRQESKSPTFALTR